MYIISESSREKKTSLSAAIPGTSKYSRLKSSESLRGIGAVSTLSIAMGHTVAGTCTRSCFRWILDVLKERLLRFHVLRYCSHDRFVRIFHGHEERPYSSTSLMRIFIGAEVSKWLWQLLGIVRVACCHKTWFSE